MIARPLAIAWKELIQLRRDRLTLAMMAVLPIVQLLLFGFAINTDVRHLPLVVYDQDGSRASRDLVRSLTATGYYDLAGHVRGYDELSRAMRTGAARVALVIPSRFSESMGSAQGATRVQLILDGSDPQTVSGGMNTGTSLIAARANALAIARLERAGHVSPSAPPLSVEVNTWYNPDLRTAVYIVPGLVGVTLTMTMVMLTAMAIVRERERGTLEQLIVSPVRRLDLVAGKILPYIGLGYIQMTLVLAIGTSVFDVPLSGSLPLLYTLAFLFISANLALGLLFSALASTQQQVMQMSMFFLLPNVLLSGFMFPYEAIPKQIRFVSQALPLTHFLRIVRGITLKGAGFSDVATEVIWLAAILGVLLSLAALAFRKNLD